MSNKYDFSFLTRKKTFNDESVEKTKLSRVLRLLDVTAIGIGWTLGSGIYILLGTVVKDFSGPATIVSFLIAGLITFLSGLCYAELGSRVPRSGSAFVYIYVTIGEFFAFVMGWDLIMEYMIGIAANSSAISHYLDAVSGHVISNYLHSLIEVHIPYLNKYFDFVAFSIAMVVTILMIIGVKESSFLNKFFIMINVSALLFIIVAGGTKANLSFWTINTTNLTWVDLKNKTQTCESSGRCGSGGFIPFGFNGLIGGAAKCFFAFIGFDAIASAGEELINPRKNIPLSIFLTLVITGSLYCGLAAVLTWMIPYYLIESATPLPDAFEYAHLGWAKYIATAGAIISLSTCLYSGMFPMPRIVYSMASDGLIFKHFSYILPSTKTPIIASLVTGLVAGVISTLFRLEELIDMLSIGTLMAYTLVSICVIVLRYRPLEPEKKHLNIDHTEVSIKKIFRLLFFPHRKEPTNLTSKLVNILLIICVFDIILMCVLISTDDYKTTWTTTILFVLIGNVLLLTFIIWRQPNVNKKLLSFKTPFVPVVPLMSVFFNIYLMTSMSSMTWIRLLVWFIIGMFLYFGYGVKNSLENKFKGKQHRYFPCLLVDTENHIVNSVEIFRIDSIQSNKQKF